MYIPSCNVCTFIAECAVTTDARVQVCLSVWYKVTVTDLNMFFKLKFWNRLYNMILITWWWIRADGCDILLPGIII
jgi:hypothetical protein